MAEKGFGVKDINLIGPSGTPTITSPNNLNLNANNVAISTNVSIGGTLSVTGNVSVGGTLTYEDVTNIDSVGLITARNGLIISGITTFNTGDVDFKGSGGSTKILFDASQDALEFADSATLAFGSHSNTGDYQINYVNGTEFGILAMQGGSQDLVIGRYENAATKKHLVSTRAGVIELYHDNSKKLETNNTGVNVTGAITVNGSALSIDPTNSDIQVVYTVTANGSSAYRFAGNGVVSTADNPDLYLIRGQKYRFVNNSGGSHPFQIREASGGTAYSTGVTNNGAASGNIDFAPTFDSPAQLVYQCTSHGGMVGNIYLRDAAGANANVGVTTFSSGIKINPVATSMYTQDGSLSYYAANNAVYLNGAGASGWLRISAAGSANNRTAINLYGQSYASSDQIDFRTNSTERYRITSNGNHYVGRPGSFGSLTGLDESSFAFTFASGTTNTHPNTNNRDTDFVEAMQIHGPVRDSTNTPALVLKESGGQATGRQSLVFFNGDYNSGAGYIKSRIYTQVGSSYLSTNFYIDVADSNRDIQNRFRINENGAFFGSSTNNISDQRLKKDIATITDPLTKIKGLTGRTFKWKEDSTKFDDETKYGFVAQEVETIVPELVNSDGLIHFDADDKICDEFEAVSHSKSVVETGVIPITVEALKVLIAKVETLEAEVAALKAK